MSSAKGGRALVGSCLEAKHIMDKKNVVHSIDAGRVEMKKKIMTFFIIEYKESTSLCVCWRLVSRC